MKGMIIYKGKYGATRQYAKWLEEELKIPMIEATDCHGKDIEDVDIIIMGSSVYIGKLKLSNWLKKNIDFIRNKKLFLFVVSGTPVAEGEKLTGYLRSSVPPEIVSVCSVYYLPGRLIYQGLSWADKFILRMGAMLAKDKKTSKEMMTDYDAVRKENLNDLLADAKALVSPGNKTINTISFLSIV